MPGDRVAGPALAVKRPDPPVAGQPPLPTLGGQGRRPRRRPGRRDRHGTAVGDGLSMPRPLDRAQVLGVRGERGLQRLGQVLQQVEAVGDLRRPGRAAPGAVGVGAGAVARHDLDAGVLPQPCGRRSPPRGRAAAPPAAAAPGRPARCRSCGACAAPSRRPRGPKARPRAARAPPGPAAAGCCARPAGQLAGQAGAGGAAQREADRRLPPARRAVLRAQGAATPGRRSAKMRRSQPALSQNRRRTRSRSATAWSPQGRSARVRS